MRIAAGAFRLGLTGLSSLMVTHRREGLVELPTGPPISARCHPGHFEGTTTLIYEFHPLANIFPLLEGNDFDELVADIKAHGQLEPVVIHEDKILDGRNRYRACLAAGINPNLVPYRGDNPLAFVISANLHRRHLDESQRAMVAGKLTNLRLGDNQHSEGLPIGRGSELLNVGERSVHRAREVLDHGAAELQQAVERGTVSVSAAADVASLPKKEQAEIVARGEREILLAAKEIRNRRAEKKRAERIEHIVEISRQNTPLSTTKSYPLILADPPWKFKVYDAESGLDSAADAHYPTMETAEIAALEIPAAKHCILFLWSTVPHLPEALPAALPPFQYRIRRPRAGISRGGNARRCFRLPGRNSIS